MADLENLYTLARRAAKEGNTENARKYYEKIVEQNPNDLEAHFYSVYYQVSMCKIAEIAPASYKITNALMSSWDKLSGIKRATLALEAINLLTSFFSTANNHASQYIRVDSARAEYVERKKAYIECSSTILDKMYNIPEIGLVANLNLKETVANYYKTIYDVSKKAPICSLPNESTIISRIKEVDPSFTTNTGGCYVATAVYGSYDCPQVWTLRRYRDYKLAKTWHGRAFIRTYYAISPTLVKWFGHTGWFRKMWKGKLDKMVSDLNKEGFENTPYEDIIW